MSLTRIYDPVRKIYVAATPEEIVRQKLLFGMINGLGYPINLIAVEKDLDSLEHLKNSKSFIGRRADIICFAKNIHPEHMLCPLLMIECKAKYLNQKTVQQVLGYNHFVKAYFVAISNGREIKTLWKNKGKYESANYLPAYFDLIKAIKHV